MERLTKNGKRTSYRPDYPNRTTTDCIKKLGKLEDIEQELGIDLITFIKAIKNGVYIKGENAHYDIEIGITSNDTIIFYPFITSNDFEKQYSDTLFLTDYGKTWALTKEELSHS